MPNRSPLPVTRALLLADAIIVEAGTGKKSLVGIYSRLIAPNLPLRQVLHVYMQLADAQGKYRFEIELVKLSTDKTIHQGQIGPVKAASPLVPLEIIMHLPCQFDEYGEYELRIIYEGNVFASRVLAIVSPPPEKPAPPEASSQGERADDDGN